MLTGHPSRTDETADSLTPSVIQPLLFPMIPGESGDVNPISYGPCAGESLCLYDDYALRRTEKIEKASISLQILIYKQGERNRHLHLDTIYHKDGRRSMQRNKKLCESKCEEEDGFLVSK